MRDEGIVLRSSGMKLSLLSRTKGRIDVVLFAQRGPTLISSGTVISYTAGTAQRGFLVIENKEVEHVPFAWAREGIYFLHYLLEVCYFFIPVGSGGTTIFALFEDVYRNFKILEPVISQKMVVCKLFAHLGIYPDDESFAPAVQLLLITPIDNMATTDLQLIAEDILDAWLLWCVCSHPHGKWFKAMPSLIKK